MEMIYWDVGNCVIVFYDERDEIVGEASLDEIIQFYIENVIEKNLPMQENNISG